MPCQAGDRVPKYFNQQQAYKHRFYTFCHSFIFIKTNERIPISLQNYERKKNSDHSHVNQYLDIKFRMCS
jgi:hypothetical protein